MTRIIKYFFLFVIIILSYFIIRPYDFNLSANSQTFSFYWLVVPGILFTLYLLVLFRHKLTLPKSVFLFFILTGYYFLSIYLGMTSWGLAVPVLGGLGAYIIKKVFHIKEHAYILVGLGFISSLVGLLFFYFNKQIKLTAGTSFSVIIGLWQLIIGIKCIVATEPVLIKEQTDN